VFPDTKTITYITLGKATIAAVYIINRISIYRRSCTKVLLGRFIIVTYLAVRLQTKTKRRMLAYRECEVNMVEPEVTI